MTRMMIIIIIIIRMMMISSLSLSLNVLCGKVVAESVTSRLKIRTLDYTLLQNTETSAETSTLVSLDIDRRK